MRRGIYCVLLAFLVAGCASTTVKAPRDARFAVVSELGNDLSLRQVGITVFGNREKQIDVSAWGVDAHVEDHVRAGLKSAGFITTAADPGWKAALGEISYFNFLSTYSFSVGAAQIVTAARDRQVDYVIVIAAAPSAFGDPFFGTNQQVTGFGVYQRRSRGIDFAQVAVILVDARTGEVVAQRTGAESSARPESLLIDVDEAPLAIETLGQPREAFLTTIDAAVRKALDRIHLSTGP